MTWPLENQTRFSKIRLCFWKLINNPVRYYQAESQGYRQMYLYCSFKDMFPGTTNFLAWYDLSWDWSSKRRCGRNTCVQRTCHITRYTCFTRFVKITVGKLLKLNLCMCILTFVTCSIRTWLAFQFSDVFTCLVYFFPLPLCPYMLFLQVFSKVRLQRGIEQRNVLSLLMFIAKVTAAHSVIKHVSLQKRKWNN